MGERQNGCQSQRSGQPSPLELVKQPSDSKNWEGPYLKKDLPTDPWDRPYAYKCPGDENRDYDIISYGADGQSGGDGENADINNWESLKKGKE